MIKEFTVDRSKWACKSNNAVKGMQSQLENPQGFKCCLGFLVEACGQTLRGPFNETYGLPRNLLGLMTNPLFPQRLLGVMATDEIVTTNDVEPNNEMRETHLTKLFAEFGVKVDFVGEYLASSSE